MDRLELEDVIVIMGAAVWKGGVASKAMRRRVEGGIASARSLANPTFLVTGGTGRYPPSEARVMERLLVESGVRPGSIVLEEESTDTLSSVLSCSKIIRGRLRPGSVTVCSDRYHIPRCRWLFKLRGIDTVAGAVVSGRKSVGNGMWIYFWVREMVATVTDTFLLIVKCTGAKLPGECDLGE